MKMHSPLLPLTLSRTRWTASAALVTLFLTACSSTPLPPWTNNPPEARPQRAKVVPSVPAPLGQPRSPSGGMDSGAQTTALPPGNPLEVHNSDSVAPPYNAAVAARFPDPAISYSTPGLAADRRAFTTNAELNEWLRNLAHPAQRSATHSKLLNLGMSQRGTPIQGLLLTRAKSTDTADLDSSGRPTVLLIGQQHGNEPAGSEALLVIASELAQGLLEPLLDRINVVIVPRANPDGAAANSRTNAEGADMNRDHLVLSTPEARAIARLMNEYQPTLVVDAHEYLATGHVLDKFNAIQRHDALLQYTTTANYPEFLSKASQEWYHQPMVAALKAENLSSDWYFTTSADREDKRLSMGSVQPDNARNVNGLKNSVNLLIETRGIGLGRLHIQRRVHTHVTAITSALRSTAERAGNLEQVRSFIAKDISSQACRSPLVVEATPSTAQRDVLFIDPQTGLDRTERVNWASALQLQTTKSRARPCGYWLAPGATTAVERLKMQGLQVMRVAEPGSALADIYEETAREVVGNASSGYSGAAPDILKVQVKTIRSAVDIPAGSYYVPLNQARANIAAAALEPDTPYSYFANHLLGQLNDAARIVTVPSLIFDESD